MPYLPDEIPNARVLITVKTYPLPSRSYTELVCTAGLLNGEPEAIHFTGPLYEEGKMALSAHAFQRAITIGRGPLSPAGHRNQDQQIRDLSNPGHRIDAVAAGTAALARGQS